MNAKLLRFGLLITLIIGISLAFIYRDQLDTVALESWVNEAGIAGPLVFMLIYIVGTVFFFPGSILTLIGGALFGPVLGTFYNLTSATIGAAISFLIARYLMSDWVEKKTGGRLKRLKDGIENEGWRFVAFVRLVPLFPFNLLNYALGLTRIRFSHYVIATYICMLPGGFAYTYLGYAGKEIVAGDDVTQIMQIVLLALALLAVVFFLPRLISAMRKGSVMDVERLKQSLDAGDDMLVLDVRTAEDFVDEQGHIVEARNIAVEELSKHLDDLSDYAEKTIALVCRIDKRSVKAAQILLRNGFADVHIVRGGMTAWNDAGYEVKK